MKILAIETSCDETAISIIEAKELHSSKKEGLKVKFKILGNEVSSQVNLHAKYGGVFPMMAKREHGKNITHILEKVLKDSKLYTKGKNEFDSKKVSKILERENELLDKFIEIISILKKPKIDAIAVTAGPGLEPTLWVGISFAKALSVVWNIPIIPINHMEGHIFSVFPKKTKSFEIKINSEMFPMLTLLVSGGHTELVLIINERNMSKIKYKKIGKTRDDAVGEAFDKVARMLELPYPGGPEIGKLAKEDREHDLLENTPKNGELINKITLPRPMMHSKDYDFSFSGIKTAVLYLIRDLEKQHSNILQNDKIKRKIAREFEDSVVETLVHKTVKALKEYKIKTLIVGGGVSANTYLQEQIEQKTKEEKIKIKIRFPLRSLSGDNALMIAIAGYFQYKNKKSLRSSQLIKADGNLSL